MSAADFQDWLWRSLLTGGAAGACVLLCPAILRRRLRKVVQLVPVAAFAVLIVLTIGLACPLPDLPVAALAVLPRWSATAGESPARWLQGAYFLVAALLLARTVAGAIAVAKLVRAARPMRNRAWRKLLADCQRTLGLRGKVRVLFAGPGFVPSATGLFRRTVLLPDDAGEWTHAQRRLVLLHELGHFRRGDLWAHALGQIACALHWFNPFAWMLQRHLALEREFACDALVVTRAVAPEVYATLLWKMGVAAQTPRLASAAFLAMAAPGRGKLEQRVRRILAPVRTAGVWLRFADGAVCGIASLLLVACASFKPVAARNFLATDPWTAQEIGARFAADPFPGDRVMDK